MKAEPTAPTAGAPGRIWLSVFFGATLLLAGVASWFLWIFTQQMERSTEIAFGHPMAPVITFFFDHRIAVLLFPLPWLVVAIYAMIRGRMPTHHLVLFASTLILSVGTLAIAMAIFFSFPWLPATRQDVPNKVFGSEENLVTFLSASEITAERLHRRPSAQGSALSLGLSAYDRDSPVPLTAEQVSAVQQLFTQKSTYGWSYGNACAPNYGVLLTARFKQGIVRIAICFDCNLLGVFDSTDDSARELNLENNLFARRTLVILVKRLFPNDPEIQRLK